MLEARNVERAAGAGPTVGRNSSGRQRTHLLALYGDLVACITSRDLRVVAILRDILLLVGAEAGFLDQPPDLQS